MTVVNTLEAQATLTQLLARVAAGEEVVITDGGQPVARLVAAHLPSLEDRARPELSPADDEDEARPWRGILLVDRPREAETGGALTLPTGPILARTVPFDILWHRADRDDD